MSPTTTTILSKLYHLVQIRKYAPRVPCRRVFGGNQAATIENTLIGTPKTIRVGSSDSGRNTRHSSGSRSSPPLRFPPVKRRPRKAHEREVGISYMCLLEASRLFPFITN